MKTQFRAISALAAMIVLLAACTSAGTGSPSASPEPTDTPPSVAPSEQPSVAPSEEPEASPEPVGTLTIVGAAVDGPGQPLADALQGDLSEPIFANGVLFLDADGNLFFADSVVDASVPTFGDIRVAVEGYPTDGPTWDIDDPNVVGLEEVDGILFYPEAQLYGTVTMP